MNLQNKSAMPRADTLIFLHIPKNAGRTFETILHRQYRSEEIYPIYGYGNCEPDKIARLKKMAESDKQKIHLVTGHLQFGLHRLFSSRAQYITFLRDPVERVISHYRYVSRDIHHPLHKMISSKNMSLHDYVAGGVSTELDNGQVRLLSGNKDKYGFGQCGEDLLEAANKNLASHFAATGIVERFDDSLLLMGRRFGWKRMYYQKKNTSARQPANGGIDQKTIGIIEKFNQLDMRLYESARRKLEQMIAAAGPAHIKNRQRLQVQNRLYRYFTFMMRAGKFLRGAQR